MWAGRSLYASRMRRDAFRPTLLVLTVVFLVAAVVLFLAALGTYFGVTFHESWLLLTFATGLFVAAVASFVGWAVASSLAAQISAARRSS